METKNTFWDLYWTVFLSDNDDFMHTQGNAIVEDGRKKSSKLFKCFKVISGNTVKVPGDNSTSHHLHSHWSLFAKCDSSLTSWLLNFWLKMHKTDMRYDQISSQNPSQFCILISHTRTHTHHLHPHIHLLEKQSRLGQRQALEPGCLALNPYYGNSISWADYLTSLSHSFLGSKNGDNISRVLGRIKWDASITNSAWNTVSAQ